MENKNQRQDISILYAVVLFVYWKLCVFLLNDKLEQKLDANTLECVELFKKSPFKISNSYLPGSSGDTFFRFLSQFPFLSFDSHFLRHIMVEPPISQWFLLIFENRTHQQKLKRVGFRSTPCQNMSKSTWKIKTHQNWNLVTLVWWFP